MQLINYARRRFNVLVFHKKCGIAANASRRLILTAETRMISSDIPCGRSDTKAGTCLVIQYLYSNHYLTIALYSCITAPKGVR